MASKKKRVVEDEMETAGDFENDSDGESIDDDGDDDSDMQINEEVQVEFEARMPDDGDYQGIRTLLQQQFLKANIDISALADLIIAQNYIGSVIKQLDIPEDDDDEDDDMEDDDTVLGVTTVINISEKKDKECVQQLRSMLIDKCQKCTTADQCEKFTKLLGDPDNHVGLLISERFINIPPQVSVPMFETLLKEVNKCKSKKMKFDFAHYLLISKTYSMGGQESKKKQEQILYTNSEEELMQEESEFSFSYSVQSERDSIVEGKWDADDQYEAFRTVMLLSADKLVTAIDKIKAELAST